MPKRPRYHYSVTTFDRRAVWWCGHTGAWSGDGDPFPVHRCSTHRGFRSLRQAMSHAAALVLRGIVDVVVLENGRLRREWLLTTKPGDGASAATSTAWARAYLALPRRKR